MSTYAPSVEEQRIIEQKRERVQTARRAARAEFSRLLDLVVMADMDSAAGVAVKIEEFHDSDQMTELVQALRDYADGPATEGSEEWEPEAER